MIAKHTAMIFFPVAALVGIVVLFPMTMSSYAVADAGHFLTKESPYISLTDPTNDSVMPIITSGDSPNTHYTFQKIPDGLGAYINGNRLNLFVNHELENATNEGGFAKV